jgi:hypothetical protein
MKIIGSLKFDASGLSQIENLRVEKLVTLPVWASGDVGRLVYITANQVLYVGGESSWVAVAVGGSTSAVQSEVDKIEVTLGGGIDTNGDFVVGGFTLPSEMGVPTSFTDAINKIAAFASGASALPDLSDVTITGATLGDALVFTGNGVWENRAPGAASGLQAHSATLDGVVSLAASTGILVKTGANSFAGREIVQPSFGITVTNGNGVAGNMTLALANDLNALEALGGSGFAVRTGADAWVQRSISGTAGRISVTNGNGVTAAPTIDLATVTPTATGTFQKITVDTYGRVSGTTPVVAGDIEGLLGNAFVDTTGDTMTGNLVFQGGATITGLPAPTGDSEAVNKAYVDARSAGLSWKAPVRAATLGNIDLASAASGYDGVTLTPGDRVLVMAQTAASENGVYVFNGVGAALTRATDMDAPADFSAATLFVLQGTVYENSGFTQTSEVAAVGTDAVAFVQFSGSSTYTWGVGLSTSGNTVSVNMGAGIAQLPTDEVGIEIYGSATSPLILTTDGTTRSTLAGAGLALLTGDGLTQGAGGISIAAGGVTNAMLANSTIVLDGDGAGTGTATLGGTLMFTGTAEQGITTDVGPNTVTISAVDASVTQKGVASFNPEHFYVSERLLDEELNVIEPGGQVSLEATLEDLVNVAPGTDAAPLGSVMVVIEGQQGDEWGYLTQEEFLNYFPITDFGGMPETVNGGDFLMGNGFDGFFSKKIYHLYQSVEPAAVHTVVHNLETTFCNVTVSDTDTGGLTRAGSVIIPESIEFVDFNTLRVTFNAAIDCAVVVMGAHFGGG